MRRTVSIFLFLFASAAVASAQVSGRAGHFYSQGVRYKAKKQNEKACKKLERAIRKSPSAADVYAALGQWYFEAHRFADAVRIFRQATMSCRNGPSRFAKPYARSLLATGQATSAMQIINAYRAARDSSEWNQMYAEAQFILSAMEHPANVMPENLGPRVNSSSPELFPSMAVDSDNLFFTRRVNNMDEDLFRARRDSCGGWFYARPLPEPPNSPDQESSQFISADGHYLFFTRCDNRSPDGWTAGGCDMLMAYRVANDSDWTQPQRFGATINTPAFEGMPTLSPDDRELYFVSDRAGGYGGYDIWISRFVDGLWQLPVNAGPNINTAGNETAPYMNADNETLYFTSDGWPGMGGSDLYVSHKINDSTYTRAQNLGYPINTAYDEKSTCVTLDGKKLYFASDKDKKAGDYDLYETTLPTPMKPIPVSYIYGVVYDSISKLRLNYAKIFISNAITGDTLYQIISNRGDASFLITLHLGNTYAIHTWHVMYTSTDDTVVFDKQYLTDPLVHNIAMVPEGYVPPAPDAPPPLDTMVLMLHFDVMRVELSDADKQAIKIALASYLDDVDYTVEVNAYTDNTGTPLINEQLSYERAKQVSKEIIAQGFGNSRVAAKGWGEAKMIATNATEDGQRMNRRVEIIIRK